MHLYSFSLNICHSRKSVTITVERLSDNSRITFTVSSEKSIEQLRAILNHHLPPHSPNRFFLHSHQRGALIHFHPPSFNLDYFPVIFDQSVLQLKMDDRNVNSLEINNEQAISREIKKTRCSFIHRSLFPPSCDSSTGKSSTTKMTCLAILKRMFSRSFRPNNVHACCQADTFRHWIAFRGKDSLSSVNYSCCFSFLFHNFRSFANELIMLFTFLLVFSCSMTVDRRAQEKQQWPFEKKSNKNIISSIVGLSRWPTPVRSTVWLITIRYKCPGLSTKRSCPFVDTMCLANMKRDEKTEEHSPSP